MKRGERGQNLVEFAIVALLLILLIAGIADIGRAFHSYMIVENASREGARYASRFPDSLTAIQNAAIREAANSHVTLVPADISVPVGLNGTRGNPVTVQIRYHIDTILGAIIGAATIPMRVETTMVIFGRDPLEP